MTKRKRIDWSKVRWEPEPANYQQQVEEAIVQAQAREKAGLPPLYVCDGCDVEVEHVDALGFCGKCE